MLGAAKLAGHGAAGLMAVAVAGAAAGCSSPAASSSGASASPASPASSASSVPSVAASAGSPAAASAAAAASPSVRAPAATARAAASVPATAAAIAAIAACPSRYLAAKAGARQGAAGSVYQVIDFTNISNAPCTLYGYPGVALASGIPVTQVGAAASRSTATSASVVTLAPGATASALLRITQARNYPPATCSPAATTYLQIYPPDQYTPIYLAYKSIGCAKTAVPLLTIGVIVAGTGG